MAERTIEIKGLDEALAKLRNAPPRIIEHVARGLYKEAETVMARSKREFVPVVTGTLRRSGHVVPPKVDGASIEVALGFGGPAAPYALCVLGGESRVLTEAGRKEISSIRRGMSVLTQTGEYREVLATSCVPAVLKPEMIELSADWRTGAKHKINLTRDHKILILRSGRRLWEQAANVVQGDCVFQRSKKTWNHGNRKYEYECSWCHRWFRASNRRDGERRYCSMNCRNAAYAGNQHPSLGKPRDMSPARQGLARKKSSIGGTEEEHAVERWLIHRGLEFEREVQVGAHYVDFYVNSENAVYEADGAYWHRDQQRDVERDKELLRDGPEDMRIFHIHFFNEKFSSASLTENPLPRVYYVSCNPGPETFVNSEVFEPIPVFSVRPWTYVWKSCHPVTPLYDLTVEGIHSFLCAGILISNSVHENPRAGKTGGLGPPTQSVAGILARTFGTGTYTPKYKRYSRVGQWKYLEQPVLEAQDDIKRVIESAVSEGFERA